MFGECVCGLCLMWMESRVEKMCASSTSMRRCRGLYVEGTARQRNRLERAATEYALLYLPPSSVLLLLLGCRGDALLCWSWCVLLPFPRKLLSGRCGVDAVLRSWISSTTSRQWVCVCYISYMWCWRFLASFHEICCICVSCSDNVSSILVFNLGCHAITSAPRHHKQKPHKKRHQQNAYIYRLAWD